MKYKSKSTGFNGISNFLHKELQTNIGVDIIKKYVFGFREHHAPELPVSKYFDKNVDYCQKHFADFAKYVKQNKNN